MTNKILLGHNLSPGLLPITAQCCFSAMYTKKRKLDRHERHSKSDANLSHVVDNFRLSLALLVEQFIEALAEIVVNQLIPVRRLVVIVIKLGRRVRLRQATTSQMLINCLSLCNKVCSPFAVLTRRRFTSTAVAARWIIYKG